MSLRRDSRIGTRAANQPQAAVPGEPPRKLRLRERVGAMRNVPPFLRLIWQTSRSLTLTTLVLRLMRALLPVATLYVGKLIIDEVVRLAQSPSSASDLSGWWSSGLLDHLAV